MFSNFSLKIIFSFSVNFSIFGGSTTLSLNNGQYNILVGLIHNAKAYVNADIDKYSNVYIFSDIKHKRWLIKCVYLKQTDNI